MFLRLIVARTVSELKTYNKKMSFLFDREREKERGGMN
jgi:hypothetical protein